MQLALDTIGLGRVSLRFVVVRVKLGPEEFAGLVDEQPRHADDDIFASSLLGLLAKCLGRRLRRVSVSRGCLLWWRLVVVALVVRPRAARTTLPGTMLRRICNIRKLSTKAVALALGGVEGFLALAKLANVSQTVGT